MLEHQALEPSSLTWATALIRPWGGRRETWKAKWHSYLGELTAGFGAVRVTPPQEHPQGRLSEELCYQVHWAEVHTICLPRTTGCLPSKGDGGGCKAVPSPCLACSCHLTLVIPPCQSLSLFVSPHLCHENQAFVPVGPSTPWGPSPCLTLLMKAFLPVLFSCLFLPGSLKETYSLWLPAPVPQACSSVFRLSLKTRGNGNSTTPANYSVVVKIK